MEKIEDRKKAALLSSRQMRKKCGKGFTLIELVLVIAIIATILAVGIPLYSNLLLKARNVQAIRDIAVAGRKLNDYLIDNGSLPETLDEVYPNLEDPWGRPYEYLVILGVPVTQVQGVWRKDQFQVPLNTDFDLYSKGKDGVSQQSLTNWRSYDDIVRANNGDYIGLGSKY